MVPAYVTDENTGNPVSHGIVERCYSRFLACVQMYVMDKQEDLHIAHTHLAMQCLFYIYIYVYIYILYIYILYIIYIQR